MKIYQKLTSWKFMCLPSATSWSNQTEATWNGNRRRCQYNFGAAGRDCCQLPPCPVSAVAAALQLPSCSCIRSSLSLYLSLYLSVLHMSSKCSATNAPQNSRLRLQLRLPTAATTVPTLPLSLPPGLSLASRSTQCVVALVNILIIW